MTQNGLPLADKNGLPLPSKKFLSKCLGQDVQDLAHKATILLGGQDLAQEPKILANFARARSSLKCLGQEVEPFAGFWLRTDWFSSGYNRHAIMHHTRARTHPYTLTPTLTHTDTCTCDLQGAVAKFISHVWCASLGIKLQRYACQQYN